MFSDINILVVDDDSLICWGLKKAISSQGIDVRTVNNGRDAFAELSNRSYNLVFLDVHLPDTNGIEMLKEIKQLAPHTKVIIMTGDDTENNRQMALEEGAFSFIPKPFNVAEIRNAVKRLTNSKDPSATEDAEITEKDERLK